MRGRLPIHLLVAVALLSVPLVRGAMDTQALLMDDPCIDPNARDPAYIVDVSHSCDSVSFQGTAGQAHTSVSVAQTADGGFVVTIVVAYADEAHTFVLECGKPGGLIPTYPVRTVDEDCWPHEEWMK